MDFSKLKFLVVDDSLMCRTQIEAILKKQGAIRVDKAENGKEALQKIKKSYTDGLPYALITLDWEMPEMNGQELLRQLRSDPKMQFARVLMVSSKTDPEEFRKIALLKPQGYLLKPFQEEVLEAKILSLLGK